MSREMWVCPGWDGDERGEGRSCCDTTRVAIMTEGRAVGLSREDCSWRREVG